MQTTLTIGPIAYDVIVVDDLRDDGDRNQRLHGEIVYGDQVIRLAAGRSPTFQRVTLWHEIIHAICEQTGLEQSEALCDALGYKLTEILIANPWLGQAPA